MEIEPRLDERGRRRARDSVMRADALRRDAIDSRDAAIGSLEVAHVSTETNAAKVEIVAHDLLEEPSFAQFSRAKVVMAVISRAVSQA